MSAACDRVHGDQRPAWMARLVVLVCVTAGCSGTGAHPSAPIPSAGATTVDAAPAAGMLPDGGAEEVMHDVLVRDPHRWLENGSDPAVRSWVDQQDARARDFLSNLPGRPALRDDLAQARRAHSSWLTQPHRRRNGRYLYGRRDPGHDRGGIFEYDPKTKRETLVLDLDANIDGNLVVSSWVTSPDGHYVVCRLSPYGGDMTQGRIFDVRSRTWLSDRIADIRYSYPAWDPSAAGFFYTWSPTDKDMPADQRTAASELRYHALRTDGSADRTVKPAPNQPGVIEVAGLSPDGRWLLAVRWDGTTKNALAVLDRHLPKPTWQALTPLDQYRYDTTFSKNALYVWTHEADARATLYAVDLTHPERGRWKPILQERPDASLDDAQVVGDYLMLTYLKDGGRECEVRRLDGTFVRNLGAPRMGELTSVGGEADETEGTVLFGTYTEPYTPYLIRPPNFEFEKFPTARVEDDDRYVTEKVEYTSPDGTRAPIYVVRARTTPAKKPAPLMLYGYGGFGEQIHPGYVPGITAWLDRGGLYAEAVVRGGGEFGPAWHEAGMREKRANVYADFLSAAQHLVDDGWTSPAKLVIRGASAGGLLVAVAMTERPDLFAGVISEVPLTDMIRYPKGVGNGPLWVQEYGSPDDEKFFPTLLRYSPYHHVQTGVKYPWLLVDSAADDDRADAMHARKFVAAHQAANPTGVVLLRTEHDAAHGGPTTETAWIESEADVYSFALRAIAAREQP
jgi:prolyl oligopeptidase